MVEKSLEYHLENSDTIISIYWQKKSFDMAKH